MKNLIIRPWHWQGVTPEIGMKPFKWPSLPLSHFNKFCSFQKNYQNDYPWPKVGCDRIRQGKGCVPRGHQMIHAQRSSSLSPNQKNWPILAVSTWRQMMRPDVTLEQEDNYPVRLPTSWSSTRASFNHLTVCLEALKIYSPFKGTRPYHLRWPTQPRICIANGEPRNRILQQTLCKSHLTK